LDALGIRWGLCHAEVVVGQNVRIIEVNCRQHNTDFVAICDAVLGYNALDLLLAAYFASIHQNDAALTWDDVPNLPNTRAYGAIVHLVCHVNGRVVGLRCLDEIQSMDSVMDIQIYHGFLPGNFVQPTKDIRSDAGWIHLINPDQIHFQRDYNRILEIMPIMFQVQ